MNLCLRYLNGRAHVLDIRDKQLIPSIHLMLASVEVSHRNQQHASSSLLKMEFSLRFSLL